MARAAAPPACCSPKALAIPVPRIFVSASSCNGFVRYASQYDKVPRTLSYCDAYLTKPLQLDALVRILGDTIAPDLEDQQTSGPVARSI